MLSATALAAAAAAARNPLRRAAAARNPLRQAARAALLLALAAAVALAGAILPAPRTAEASTVNATAISIVTTPGSAGYYATGDRITFEITFDQTMKDWPSPYRSQFASDLASCFRFSFLIGSTTRYACGEDHMDGTHNSTTVQFHYDVVADDHDADGISVPTAAVFSNTASVTHLDSGADHVGAANTGTAVPDDLNSAQSAHPVNTADYDADDDDLIEITTLAQLNAVRYDLDGEGDQDSTSNTNWTAYKTAFHGVGADMGCASGAGMCDGYELDADLDFAGSADYANWAPIGVDVGNYTGQFYGRGHTISNLTVTTNSRLAGLFASMTGGANCVIDGVELLNVNITSNHYTTTAGELEAGALVGYSECTVRNSYATGAITINNMNATNATNIKVGGLIGYVLNSGTVASSWAQVNITSDSNSTRTDWHRAGGLVGFSNDASITASYARGNVTLNRTGGTGVGARVGGLIGEAWNSPVTASYSTGAPSSSVPSGETAAVGGLIGRADGGGNTTVVTNSYWDTETSNQATSGVTDATSTNYVGKTTRELQSPTEYGDSTATPTPIYSAWNVNVDGDTTTGTPTVGGDDPWDFGNATDYPILKFGHSDFSQDFQRPTDHTGDNNLIDVSTPAQLDAIRYDLDGNGDAATNPAHRAAHRAAYLAAFPGLTRCAATCNGYELTANLDLSAPAYTTGAGFTPIGMNDDGSAGTYTATFDGNDHTISNLTINLTTTTLRGGSRVGLFARTTGAIRDVGLVNPSVSNTRSGDNQDADELYTGRTGALVGFARSGSVSGSWVDGGTVAMTQSAGAGYNDTGCLVGYTEEAAISSSWASCAVSGSTAAGATGIARAGGLVGGSTAAITSSYATGTVSASGPGGGVVGGLAGFTNNGAAITSSYATGAVSNSSSGTATNVGGLVGSASNTNIKASFATGNVEATASRSVGGLVGRVELSNNRVIEAAYATGSVSRTSASGGGAVGGLIGIVISASGGTGAAVRATYATGAVSNADSAGAVGGLVGSNGSTATPPHTPVTHSYWNSDASGGTGQTSSAACANTMNCVAQTGDDLKSPTGYGGIYPAANWNLNLDGVAGGDDPWHFGTATEYPVLTYGFDLRVIRLQRGAVGNTDYDANDNNLIDIGRAGVDGLHQLNAVRWDLDGSGEDGITGPTAFQYLAAFPDLMEGMGCPDGCVGYELLTDLDFDDDGSGTVDSDDAYENWNPIGASVGAYSGDFQGNGHTISNLTINASGLRWVGLFGELSGGEYGGIALEDVDITSTYSTSLWAATGALVGQIRNAGLTNSYSTGSITYNGSGTTYSHTGGLIGETFDSGSKRYTFASLWSSANVTVNSTAVNTYWRAVAGGLIGKLHQGNDVVACYATGAVSSPNTTRNTYLSGLIGYTNYHDPAGPTESAITASYAAGVVSSGNTSATINPLRNDNRAAIATTVTDSYWDSTGMGQFLDAMGDPPPASEQGVAQTIFDLQTPTNAAGYAGIYADWNVDIDNADGDDNPATGGDDPWDFGTDREYPALKTGYLGAPDLLTLQRPIDYDRDGDNLIEITTPAQLDAVRWAVNGNVANIQSENQAAFYAAFPRKVNDAMGCAATCNGYELDADLDLSGYPNWAPLSSVDNFDGNGHVIRNLTITDAGLGAVGLFGTLSSTSVIESVGLIDANVASSSSSTTPPNFFNVGALVGFTQGIVRYSYATGGTVQATVNGGASEITVTRAGGLVGGLGTAAAVSASWTDMAVTITSNSTSTTADSAGGLVGLMSGNATVTAAYAKGNVSANRGTPQVGGLVGNVGSGTTVEASYSIGVPSTTGAATDTNVGGLVGANAGTINNSYWDETTTGITTGSNGAPHSTSDLQSVTGYTGGSIYVFWNVNVDGQAGTDDPWYFGSMTAYPILQFGYTAANISRQLGVEPVNDYDTNGNGLIEVSSLAQLNAIRWDLTGEGTPATADTAAYLSSFPGPLPGMGCPGGRCDGYELTADLDFDTGTAGDRTDDEYYNGGAGWTPIAAETNLVGYTGRFVGNGHTIANLYINHTVGSRSYHGLFGNIGTADTAGAVSGVGLPNASVTAYGSSVLMGTLAGRARAGSVITASWATGSLTSTSNAGTGTKALGGLVGHLRDGSTAVRGSWAAVTVTADAAAGLVVAGGLVGRATDGADVLASYATGAVSGGQGSSTDNGGLVGSMGGADSNITASYAIGKVSAGTGGAAGGLVASITADTTVTDSYWDNQIWTDTSANGVGKTTAELQSNTNADGYTGDFANWNVNVDGDASTGDADGNDDPWDFGTDREYPVLKYRHLGAPALLTLQRPLDYDRDGDNLIEITTPAQLNVVRWDTDGDGANIGTAGRADYAAAFPNAMADMGCAATCAGYELEADLDLSGYPNWTPINAINSTTTVTFQGNGHTIRNLRITAATSASVGLFTSIGENAVVESVGLVDVNIADTSTLTSSVFTMGALAGSSEGTIRYSYATGAVSATLAGGATGQAITRAGGLVGSVAESAAVAASWADVTVNITSDSASPATDAAGGIVGGMLGTSTLTATYAKGNVSADRDLASVGGLVGSVASGATVTASYSIGAITAHASADAGGLVGANAGTNNISASYFDTDETGLPAGTHGRTTMALQEPQEYGTQSTDIYMNWNVDVDADTNADDPWYFGGADDYPILQFGYNAAGISLQMGVAPVNDYDPNNNGLIDIANLAALNAIRYDLDGDGDPSDIAAYLSGFPGPVTGMGCPPVTGCTGYELTADLDFDENNDGEITAADATWWDGGAGWDPIGTSANAYTAIFDGGGHTISNLFISRPGGAAGRIGLFAHIGGSNAVVHSVGLINPDVTHTADAGALVGTLAGIVQTGAKVYSSYAIGGSVSSSISSNELGGLIGRIDDTGTSVIACYVLGTTVAGTAGSNNSVGGLVGGVIGNARLTGSYAVGSVSAVSSTNVGGVVGQRGAFMPYGVIDSNNYWDNDVDSSTSSFGAGQTTDDLQSTDDYSGIFATWDDADLDGDGNNDAPWAFLDNHQYPILRLGHTAASIAAQTAPQDTGLRSVSGSNVDRTRPGGDPDWMADYTLEIQPSVAEVTLAVTPTQSGAMWAVTSVVSHGVAPDQRWTAGNTIPVAELSSVVVLRVTSPNGYSTQEYRLHILRIFCPKAEINGPANMVGEGGSADFTILVCGTTEEPVIVSWAVVTEADGNIPASTATAADLGRALTGQITVPMGVDREATLSFPITDDDEPEPSETITVRITGVAGGTERIDTTPATATIALSDPSLTLRAPEGTGAGGAGDSSDTPLTASSMLVLTEGAGRSYSLRLAGNPQESVTIVIHSNHQGVTTTPDRVTFDRTNFDRPQRITVNAAQDGDDNHDRATLTHILTDEAGNLLEIIDRIPLFVTDTDPPDDDDIC